MGHEAIRIDGACRKIVVRAMMPLLKSHTIRKLFPREIVQFLFHKKDYTAFEPAPDLMNDTAISNDPIRYASVVMAIHRLQTDKIPGAMAELGVYKGVCSHHIHHAAPERVFFLFDTFRGFPGKEGHKDRRFQDATVEGVRTMLGNSDKLRFCEGIFPETAKGLEDEKFAFVMLDADKFEVTLAGLKFFWPRLTPGGYLFAHDYGSSESDWGVSRAFKSYFKENLLSVIDIPDKGGSAIIRKAQQGR